MRLSRPTLAATICFGYDDPWLPFAVSSVYAAVDALFILISSHPWRGSRLDSRVSVDTVKSFPDPEGKITVIHGNWGSEIAQRNYALSVTRTRKFDYTLILDPDEVYTSEHLLNAIRFVSEHPDIDAFNVSWLTYWKSVRHRIDPIESFRPTLILKSGKGSFTRTRIIELDCSLDLPFETIHCHHLSFAHNESFLRPKLEAFGLDRSRIELWLSEKWRAWDTNPATEDLHPLSPPLFRRALEQSRSALPEVLRGL